MKRFRRPLLITCVASVFIVQSCTKNEYAPKTAVKNTTSVSPGMVNILHSEIPGTSGIFQIISQSGLSDEIANNSTAVGGISDLAAYASTAFQKWKITLVTDNYVTIQNAGSGLYMQSYPYNGTEVLIQAPPSGADAQLFSVSLLNDGYFKVINKADGLAVTANGTGMVQLNPFTGDASQVWSGNELSLFTAQSQYGPGGNNYAYPGVTQTAVTINGITSYIFQPSPMPDKSLPCISYQHGYWPAPALYLNTGYINHLVKKGYIVIYDEFEPTSTTLPNLYESIAANNIRGVMNYIASNPSTCVQVATYPDGSKQFGLAGYSIGAITSVNLAANYIADSIPRPKFLYTMEANSGNNLAPMRNANTVPSDIFLVMVDAQDDIEGTFDNSSAFWNQMTQVPASNKQWIGIYSDTHPNNDTLNLIANHFSPDSNTPNALNFYGFYKWTTALANYTFYGIDYSYWWGDDSDEDYMGTWDDGVPVITAKASQTSFWPGH